MIDDQIVDIETCGTKLFEASAELVKLSISLAGSFEGESNSPKWVVVFGELGDGLQGVVGTFDTEEEAEEYADTHSLGHYEKCIYQLCIS